MIPSTPAKDADVAHEWWRLLSRQALLRHAKRAAVIAVGVVVVGAGVSVYLSKVGMKRCAGDVCTETHFYPLTVQRSAETVTVADDVTHRREWHRSGAVWIEGAYNHDARIGEWRENYADGSPRFVGSYADDKLVGKETWYYPGGAPEWQVGRKDGQLDGEERWWHPNGELRRIGNYKAGERDGTFTVFDDSGHVAFKGEYKDGANISGQRVD